MEVLKAEVLGRIFDRDRPAPEERLVVEDDSGFSDRWPESSSAADAAQRRDPVGPPDVPEVAFFSRKDLPEPARRTWALLLEEREMLPDAGDLRIARLQSEPSLEP